MMMFVVTFVAFAVLVGGMALAVLVTGRRLQGSCGGLGSLARARSEG